MEEFTNDDFWDCECERNYIHSKDHSQCPFCGADESEMPDSLSSEVKEYMDQRLYAILCLQDEYPEWLFSIGAGNDFMQCLDAMVNYLLDGEYDDEEASAVMNGTPEEKMAFMWQWNYTIVGYALRNPR